MKERFKIISFFYLYITVLTVTCQSSSCNPGFFLSGTTCRKCTIGSYCSDGKTQKPCPPGSYTDLYEQSSCRLCRIGWYQTMTSQVECLRCGLGQFCPNSTELPRSCPPGTYAHLYGQIKCRRFTGSTIHLPGCFNVNA